MSKKSKKIAQTDLDKGTAVAENAEGSVEAVSPEAQNEPPEAPEAPAPPETQNEPEAPAEPVEPEEAPEPTPEPEPAPVSAVGSKDEIKGKQKADIKVKLPEAVESKLQALAVTMNVNPDKIVIEDFDEEESKGNPEPAKRTDLAVPDGTGWNIYKVLTDQDYDWKGPSGFQTATPEKRDKDGNPLGGIRYHCYLIGKRDSTGHFEEEEKLGEKKSEDAE